MILLALSDVVNPKLYSPSVLELKDKIDLIVSCGDLPMYYLDYISTTLGKPLFFVCGNHDNYDYKKKDYIFKNSNSSKYFFSDREDIKMGGINLDGRVEEYKGFIFAGLEGSMEYNKGEHQYSDKEMKRKINKLSAKLIFNKLRTGRFLDVFVTHSPPFGIHDRDDLPHRGFKSFVDFIEKFSPAYLIHGHSHIYDRRELRETVIGRTKVINCYDHIIINIERE